MGRATQWYSLLEGEDSTDKGKIIVDNNHITTKVARVVYD
jgi:hypothetical protein